MAEQQEAVETTEEVDVTSFNPEEVQFGIVEEETDAGMPEAELDNEPVGEGEPEPEKEADPETSPEVETDKTPEKPAWDKDRQVKDQEIAGLKKQNAQLTDALATKSKSGSEPKAADDTLDLDSELPELDEYADEETRVARINLLTRRDTARRAMDTQKGNKDAYDAILVECDEKFGAEFRNDAVARVEDIWKEEGFSPDNLPDAASTRLAVRGVYAELQNVQLREPKKPTKKTSSSPKPDTGRGGTVARKAAAGMMTTDEAVASMRKSGELDWAT